MFGQAQNRMVLTVCYAQFPLTLVHIKNGKLSYTSITMEKNINIINKTLYKYIEKLSKNRALRSSIIKTKISNIEIAPTYIKSINKDIN